LCSFSKSSQYLKNLKVHYRVHKSLALVPILNQILFERLEILALPCEYIFSLINFITNNEEHFQTNADVHSVNTRHKDYIYKPAANLSCFQKSTYYAGIRIFSCFPSDLKSLMKEKARLQTALK
jgi:hypothetical protein